MTKIDIYFDGACKNTPKHNPPMGVGVAIVINDQLQLSRSTAMYYVVNNIFLNSMVEEGMKRGTSNIAEWQGCFLAMTAAAMLRQEYGEDSKITVYSDSELITKQFNGEYLIKQGDFLWYERHASAAAKEGHVKKIIWIPREKNTVADTLSKIGLKRPEEHIYYGEGLQRYCEVTLD